MREENNMPRKRSTVQIETPAQLDVAPEIEVKKEPVDLSTTLEAIKAKEGVVGYILREQTSASVNIGDPSKIMDYALVSASLSESVESFSEAFQIGKICNIVAVANKLKILQLGIGEQRISIFMDENVNHESICKKFT